MYFTNKNVKLYYEKYGNKENTLLILPGWGDNRKTFSNIINLLTKKYTVYIFDYPGFGNSTFLNNELDIYQYSNIFIDFMNEFNIKNPTIIGHSFGGRLIILLNAYYNIRFKKIILIDSAGIKPKKNIMIKLKQTIYKILKKLKVFFPKSKRKKYLNKLINIFGSNDYKNLNPKLRNTFIKIVNEDLKYYIKDIKDETLIIWGEKDLDTPLKDAYYINNQIKNSGLVIIKNAHHFSYLEYPIYVNKILINFLNIT